MVIYLKYDLKFNVLYNRDPLKMLKNKNDVKSNFVWFADVDKLINGRNLHFTDIKTIPLLVNEVWLV